MLRKCAHREDCRNRLNTLTTNFIAASCRQSLFLLAIAAVPGTATFCFDLKWKAPAEFRSINGRSATSKAQEYAWVDVRSFERYDQAHISNAVSFDEAFPDAGLESLLKIWKPGMPVVVYGEGVGSERAERVARWLQKALNTKDVRLLEGGWATWPRD